MLCEVQHFSRPLGKQRAALPLAQDTEAQRKATGEFKGRDMNQILLSFSFHNSAFAIQPDVYGAGNPMGCFVKLQRTAPRRGSSRLLTS